MVALLADIPPRHPPARRTAGPARRCTPARGSGRARPSAAVLRSRRLVATGVAVAVLLCGWIALQAALGHTGGGPLTVAASPGGLRPISAGVWVVRPGDTLWSIAERIFPHADVRPLVDRLAAQVGNHPIYPGERIVLP